MQKRWLFVWRDMSRPEAVDRTIALFPRAAADGYNGLVFSYNVAAEKAAELKAAAAKYHLALYPLVMGEARDRNDAEGVPVQDALYLAHDGIATFQPDNPTRVVNGGFEDVTGNHINGWTLQDDEGVTTFADHGVVRSGSVSLRMQDIGKNPYHHARLAQPLKLQPHRQYRISFWVKTENLQPADPNVEVLDAASGRPVSFETFHTDPTQDWKRCDIAFNSMDCSSGLLYLGEWDGNTGKLWWDGIQVQEIGLVNVLRRPGCPVTVRSEDGTVYEEGKDYRYIQDPMLNPWVPYHEEPIIRLTPGTRIRQSERLRVSYYHPIIVYEDRVTSCLSEPSVFQDWTQEVQQANDLLHPAGFFMQHDELRCIDQCALCQSKHMTPGQLLAWNVHKAAAIIHKIRPDAEVWVWSDMFDPMHNAVDHYYAVNGSLSGSWKGLDPSIGIVNWNGGVVGKDCPFFAKLGLRQILSGYYDGDKDGSQIGKWEANTRAVPGIVGAMYTTWQDDYGDMDRWAKVAWGGGK